MAPADAATPGPWTILHRRSPRRCSTRSPEDVELRAQRGSTAATIPAMAARTTTTARGCVGDVEGVEALVGHRLDQRPAEEHADDEAEHGALEAR